MKILNLLVQTLGEESNKNVSESKIAEKEIECERKGRSERVREAKTKREQV